MKTLQKLLFLGLIYQALPFASFAQPGTLLKSVTPDKPFLFARIPEKFECDARVLRQLFSAEVNDNISFSLPGNQFFKGTVNAKVQRDENVLSVNIFSTNYPGTLLSISLVKETGKSEKMLGRFLNPRNGDVLLIEQENDRYFITKDLQKFVMTECPLPEAVQYESGL
jgi:hypothetical protein